jgi:hypothetical protein
MVQNCEVIQQSNVEDLGIIWSADNFERGRGSYMRGKCGLQGTKSLKLRSPRRTAACSARSLGKAKVSNWRAMNLGLSAPWVTLGSNIKFSREQFIINGFKS